MSIWRYLDRETAVTQEMVDAWAHVVMAEPGLPIAEGFGDWRLTRDEKNVLTFNSQQLSCLDEKESPKEICQVIHIDMYKYIIIF